MGKGCARNYWEVFSQFQAFLANPECEHYLDGGYGRSVSVLHWCHIVALINHIVVIRLTT